MSEKVSRLLPGYDTGTTNLLKMQFQIAFLLFVVTRGLQGSTFIQKGDTYTNGEIVDRIQTFSVFTCLHKCKMHGECNVINFNKLQQKCELLHAKFNSDYQKERKKDWISAEMNDIHDNKQHCSSKTCSSMEKSSLQEKPFIRICGNLSKSYIFNVSTSPTIWICLNGNPRPNVTWSFKTKGVPSVALLDASTHSYNFTYQLPPLTSSMCGEVVSFHAVGYAGETVIGNASIIVKFPIPKLENVEFIYDEKNACGNLTWNAVPDTGACRIKYIVSIITDDGVKVSATTSATQYNHCKVLQEKVVARVWARHRGKAGPKSDNTPLKREPCVFESGVIVGREISDGFASNEQNCKDICFELKETKTVTGISYGYLQCSCYEQVDSIGTNKGYRSCVIR